MKFEYFYGNEAEQYDFIQIPSVLITDNRFAELSSQAKILYGFLLDRMGLSMKNQWMDEEGRVYVVYPVQEIMKDIGISKRKTIESMEELEKIGLVERIEAGMSIRIYLKNYFEIKEVQKANF